MVSAKVPDFQPPAQQSQGDCLTSSSRLLSCLTAVFGLALGSAALADDNRYIIQFAPGAAGQGKAAVQAFGGEIKVDLTDRNVNVVAATLPAQAAASLQNNPNVVQIEKDSRVHLMADEVPYGIRMVQADQVLDGLAGNRTICVIDSGYYTGHNDLQTENVTATPDSGSGDPFIDPCGHGTHVAGTIAALANGSGVLGVLPSGNINLHIVKTFGNDNWSGGSCAYSYSSSILAAGYACADAGADVINMSLGGGSFSSSVAAGWQEIYDSGVLPVASAGNSGNTSLSYPASYDAVISVAAIDENMDLASFSQRNDQVELAGPGVGVLSTVPFTNANVTVDRDYLVEAMSRSASTTASGGLVDGGLCTSVGNWSGQVVLCERGQVSFSDKVNNVQSGGGVAAIVYNNEPGGFGGELQCGGNPNRPCSSIPAVSMTRADGQSLVANELGSSADVSTVQTVPASGYAFYNGTSMSAPHVAAVAALVWSYAPELTAPEIRAALAASAMDLGTPGRNNEFGYGLVQAKAALDFLELGGTEPGPDPEPEPEPNEPPVAAFSFSCDELECSFDGSASSDSDGTIESYSWTFGDGNSGSGATVSHTYADDGSYTVTLTVTDNDGDSDSISQQVSVEAIPDDEDEDDNGGGDTDMVSVGDISVSVRSRGPWRNGEASVTVIDGDGNPVSGATVTGTFSGDVNGTVTSEATGGNGVAILESDRVRQNSISFTFCVDSISASGLDYDADGNSATCASN
ncbi:MAG: PKD domain-containing protein [Wenzhouxiangella sp.]|nr:MAG: PKD domain-containing protein [Wenzhouxiangella sp.]